MTTLTFEQIEQLLLDEFGVYITKEENIGLQNTLYIDTDKIVQVCIFLKESPATYFDFLSSITALDKGENNFELVYHLASIPYKNQLTLKIKVFQNENTEFLPEVPSVSGVWKTADWHERETYDLFGIFFRNHPDLRRILLPDDWEGYPLRKNYKAADTYRGMPIQ